MASKYIMRLHRIRPDQDKKVKKLKKKDKISESEVVRRAIDLLPSK